MKPFAVLLSMLFTVSLAEAAGPRAQKPAGSRQTRSSQNGTGSSMRYDAVGGSGSFLKVAPVVGFSSTTFADVKGQNGVSVRFRPGMMAGAAVLAGSGALKLDTGLFYAEYGANLDSAWLMKVTIDQSTKTTFQEYSPANAEFVFKYLDVPLLARYEFRPESRTGFYVRGGLVLGLLQSAQARVTVLTGDVGGGSQDMKNQMKDLDPRFAAGGGGRVKLTRSLEWLIQLDYQQSLERAQKETDATPLKNAATTLSTGLAFEI